VPPTRVIGASIERGGSRNRLARALPLSAICVLALFALLVFSARADAGAVKGGRATVEFSCTGVTFNYSGFPDLPGNTVKTRIRIDGVFTPPKPEFVDYTFNGPTGSYTFPFNLSPGHHGVDGLTKWKTNGVRGSIDKTLGHGIVCAARPLFTIQKLQEVIGGETGEGGFTSEPLSAAIGQSVRYRIIVSNTGNVPLTLDSLDDPRCDPGTISGGPDEALGVGKSTVYVCEHVVGLADLGQPTYTNTVTISATSLAGEGEPEGTTVSAASNTVVVNLLAKEPPPKEPPPKEPPAGNEQTPSGASGATQTSQTSGTTAQQGVGGVVASALPNPVFGRSANLLPAGGVVLIKVPGGKRFLRLRAGTTVPIGTIIDATLGRVQLITAADTASHTQETGVFYGGVFRLEQATLSGAGAGNALTVLKLVGPLPACLVKKFGKKAAITAAKRRTRKLWGQAKGNFRTVGRYAAATVRGTKWLTEDMCAGTLIRVVEHTVKVDAFPHNRHFLLGQGRSFIAHP